MHCNSQQLLHDALFSLLFNHQAQYSAHSSWRLHLHLSPSPYSSYPVCHFLSFAFCTTSLNYIYSCTPGRTVWIFLLAAVVEISLRGAGFIFMAMEARPKVCNDRGVMSQHTEGIIFGMFASAGMSPRCTYWMPPWLRNKKILDLCVTHGAFWSSDDADLTQDSRLLFSGCRRWSGWGRIKPVAAF